MPAVTDRSRTPAAGSIGDGAVRHGPPDAPDRGYATRVRGPVVARLHQRLAALADAARELEAELGPQLDRVEGAARPSARNLVHYLALRRHDLRDLQIELRQLGLSSLGRLEAHVLPGLHAVLWALERLAGGELAARGDEPEPAAFAAFDSLLAERTGELFGAQRGDRAVRIMVTLPSEAADESTLLRDLLDAGTDVVRINTAHDDPDAWARMVRNTRRAAAETGRSCRVLLDLAGPKLRTGAIEPGPAVIHPRAARDRRGTVIEPARFDFVLAGTEAARQRGAVPIDAKLWAALRPGDRILLRDLPGRRRKLVVGERRGDAVPARSKRGLFLEEGVRLVQRRRGVKVGKGRVGALRPADGRIRLQRGDRLVVTDGERPGRPAARGEDGTVLRPAEVPCTLPEILADVEAGQRIFFDDGKLGGVVRRVGAGRLEVEITRARAGGAWLRDGKGINLPDTEPRLPALTAEDLAALDALGGEVDLVGLSFVGGARDVELLHRELGHRGLGAVGVVLKIETRRGFASLPEILLAGLRRPPLGVMVARGDLGVEVGFERLAEVQEEILWLCEAAHVPVVWATQVLEKLCKSGLPTRGEVTDAAMSARADCVMLNKGPYVVETVRFLDDILRRMQDHHHKKTAMLRKLEVSRGRWSDRGRRI